MNNQTVLNKQNHDISTQKPIEPKRRRKAGKIVLISLCAFILIFSIAAMLITKYVYDDNFGRADASAYTSFLRYEDITGYERTQISFMSGNNKLAGYIYGEDNDKGLIVIAHGLGGGAESYLPETMYFVDNGWRVFSYDCTGSYNSEGEGTKGLPQSAIDIDAALNYIESQNWNLPIMLYGHSWGGYAVTAVLNYEHDISAVVSIAGYATPMELLYEQSQDMMGWFATITYPYQWLYQRMLFGSTAGLSAVAGINKSSVPVMVIHGSEDTVIRYDGAGIIAHKDKIKNPNVVYRTCDSENQSGHNNLFMSTERIPYVDKINEEYKAIYDSYDGNVPDEIKAEFNAGIDKYRVSELDYAFMSDVNVFFEKYAE